jgi:hypothetical protein
VRNRPESLDFLKRCLETDTSTVQEWWDPHEHGMFTHSDQDTMLYQILSHSDQRAFSIVSHLDLNAREYHYRDRLDEHFICHFPGLPNKVNSVRTFGGRFGVGATLIPGSVLKAHGCEEWMGEEFVLLPQASFWERVRRRVRRTVRPLASR